MDDAEQERVEFFRFDHLFLIVGKGAGCLGVAGGGGWGVAGGVLVLFDEVFHAVFLRVWLRAAAFASEFVFCGVCDDAVEPDFVVLRVFEGV